MKHCLCSNASFYSLIVLSSVGCAARGNIGASEGAWLYLDDRAEPVVIKEGRDYT